MTTAARRKAVLRRETRFLPDGSYAFRDRIRVERAITARVLTGHAWLLERFEIESGTLCFLSGPTTIRPNRSPFWFFYPPFSIARVSLSAAQGIVIGKAGLDLLSRNFTLVPFLFESEASIYDDPIEQILSTAANVRFVEAYPGVSSLSRKALRLIAKLHVDQPSIGRIARQLGVSHPHLSRQFRRDYGMAPKEYLHRLRLADVPLRLARGESIAEASWAAGYRDLSRFYTQFRKLNDTPPARCRAMVRPR